MKRLPVVILVVVAVLGAVVSGCRNTPRYDGRLAAADSLMRNDADSALAMLEALPLSELHTSGDSAYRDLLLTQARYRAYVTATSDSDINRALAYYRARPAEREKLTRAYIYKGAVMEELGHPDSAMLYYKHAENTASPDDYFNLGYCNLRMGALYRDHHAMDGKDIEKHEEALDYLMLTDDEHYQLVCMVNLGSLYCLKFPEKADSVLNHALILAEQIGDTSNYVCAIQNLIKNDMGKGEFTEARKFVQQVMAMDNPTITIPLCLYAAHTYAHLHEPDSAEIFLKLVEGVPITNDVDKISYLEAKGDIALARGDTSSYLSLINKCELMSDSLQSLTTPLNIMTAEDKIEQQSHLATKLSQQVSASWNWILATLLILILLVGTFIFIRRRKRHKKQLSELMEISESQLAEIKLSLENLNKFDIKESKLKEFLNSYMGLMRDIMEECYLQPSQQFTKRIHNVIRFQKNNRDIWEKLYGYIDMEYDGLMSKTKTNYPHLNDKDLLLIAMTALKFSYIQMSLVLGYVNASTISSKKLRLAKKMGIDGSLNEYIEQFKCT